MLFRIKLAAVVTAMLALTGCGEDPNNAAADTQALQAGLKARYENTLRGKRLAHDRIAELGLYWEQDVVLRVPQSADQGPSLDRPRAMAQKVTPHKLSLSERRANGRDVFRSETGKTVVKVDVKRGYWKLIGARAKDPQDAPFSLDQAVSETGALFDNFNLPGDQRGTVVYSDLLAEDAEGHSNVMGRHVRIHRQINGLRVLGSRLMTTYDLTGNPFRIESRWPAFRVPKVGHLHTPNEAVEEISSVLANRFADSSTVGDVKAELAYHFREDGTFEPVLSVWVFSANGVGFPDHVEYSLVRGIDYSTMEPATKAANL